LSGEANKIADGDVNEWLQDFVKVRQSYAENDIFNIDETGVFFIICCPTVRWILKE
jgi:hypothetical protein